MVLGISILLTPWVVFLAAILLVGIAIVVLTIIERRLNRRLVLRKQEEESSIDKKLRYLPRIEEDPKKFLKYLDEIAREFFEEHFQIGSREKYSDLIGLFEERKEPHIAKFCSNMQEVLYSGERLDKEKLEFLSRNLKFLVGRERKIRPMKEKVREKEREELIRDKIEKKIRDILKKEKGKEKVPTEDEIGRKIKEEIRGELAREKEAREKAMENEIGERIKEVVKEEEAEKKKRKDMTLDEEIKKRVKEAIEQERKEKTISPEEKIKERVKKVTEERKESERREAVKKESWVKRLFGFGKTEEMNRRIIHYLAEGKRRGISVGVMRQNLLNGGFDRREIDRAVKYLGLDKYEKKEAPVEKPIVEVKKVQEKKPIVEVKEEKPRRISVVPFKREMIAPIGRVRLKKREPKAFKLIEGIDDLGRVRKKIKRKENVWASGVAGGGVELV